MVVPPTHERQGMIPSPIHCIHTRIYLRRDRVARCGHERGGAEGDSGGGEGFEEGLQLWFGIWGVSVSVPLVVGSRTIIQIYIDTHIFYSNIPGVLVGRRTPQGRPGLGAGHVPPPPRRGGGGGLVVLFDVYVLFLCVNHKRRVCIYGRMTVCVYVHRCTDPRAARHSHAPAPSSSCPAPVTHMWLGNMSKGVGGMQPMGAARTHTHIYTTKSPITLHDKLLFTYIHMTPTRPQSSTDLHLLDFPILRARHQQCPLPPPQPLTSILPSSSRCCSHHQPPTGRDPCDIKFGR